MATIITYFIASKRLARSVARFAEICRQEGLQTVLFVSFDTATKGLLQFLFRLDLIRRSSLPKGLLYTRFQVYMWLCPSCTDADPLKQIWVDPNKIEFYYRGEPQRFGIVEGGSWDQAGVRFEETGFYRILEQRYSEGHDWQETQLYQQWKQEIVDNESSHRFDTLSELQSYVDSVDKLYERIDEEGYKSQVELFAEDPSKAWKANNDALHPILNEVAINIGRDGQMGKKSSGKHRLAIAKILDIDCIPVVVRARHSEWQDTRFRVKEEKTKNNKSDSFNHPDLKDII